MGVRALMKREQHSRVPALPHDSDRQRQVRRADRPFARVDPEGTHRVAVGSVDVLAEASCRTEGLMAKDQPSDDGPVPDDGTTPRPPDDGLGHDAFAARAWRQTEVSRIDYPTRSG